MIKTIEGRTCGVGDKNEAVVICNGCGRALCIECRIFDIWGYGCGHGNPMAFCKKCDGDPSINLWKATE